ncbi:MAG: DNA repair protein RadC [Ignavibacteria bacterium]|nr:DNA repair protein RadC [Ignavibacteria bacterium]
MEKDKHKSKSNFNPDNSYKPIREWRLDDRPREKLIKNGANTLSDSELLAILISTGTKSLTALDLAKLLLDKYQNLYELSTRDISELKSIKGIGLAKSVTLSAAFELSRRIQSTQLDQNSIIRSPSDIANYFIPLLKGIKQERFYVVLLNSSNKIIRIKAITEGTLNASLIHPREVFRFAITESSASIILVHNHPSGNPTPSNEDIEVTKKLMKASQYIEIPILDHIIIAGNNYTSLANLGVIGTKEY